jgi:hypothetical protein
MKTVGELEVGDVFYTQTQQGIIDGPYAVTKEGICGLSNRNISLGPCAKALSERDIIQEALRKEGRFQDDDSVEAWIKYGFDANCACQWIRIGCWDADIADALREAGIGPLDVWHTISPFELVKGGYAKFVELVHKAKNNLPNTGS